MNSRKIRVNPRDEMNFIQNDSRRIPEIISREKPVVYPTIHQTAGPLARNAFDPKFSTTVQLLVCTTLPVNLERIFA